MLILNFMFRIDLQWPTLYVTRSPQDQTDPQSCQSWVPLYRYYAFCEAQPRRPRAPLYRYLTPCTVHYSMYSVMHSLADQEFRCTDSLSKASMYCTAWTLRCTASPTKSSAVQMPCPKCPCIVQHVLFDAQPRRPRAPLYKKPVQSVHVLYSMYSVMHSLADHEFRCTVQVHTVFWGVPYIIYDIPDLTTTEPLPPCCTKSEMYKEIIIPFALLIATSHHSDRHCDICVQI